MNDRRLRIVHCFRAPVGGVFRHVGDLAEAQHRAGNAVGIICDSTTGGPFEEERLKRLAPFLDLIVVWNRGISYGLFQQHTELGRWALVVVSIVAGSQMSPAAGSSPSSSRLT